MKGFGSLRPYDPHHSSPVQRIFHYSSLLISAFNKQKDKICFHNKDVYKNDAWWLKNFRPMCLLLVYNGPRQCTVYCVCKLCSNKDKICKEKFLKGLQEGPPQLFVTNGTQLHPRRASELNFWTEGHPKYFLFS